MEKIKNLLKAREEALLSIKKSKEKELASAPNGTLRICSHGNRTQYYRREDPKDFNGVYIREKDVDIAKKLAQKEYNKKLLYAVEKELKVIRRFLTNYPLINVEQLYERLSKERQKLIEPITDSEDIFVKKWESVEYRGKGFLEGTPELYTSKGERVRSKSEVIIADTLEREGIPYRYENPIYLNGVGKIYPDFTVLNVKERKEIYWEHLGMMDDPEYVEKAIKKISSYERNDIFPGDQLILTYETRNLPINQKMIMLMIERYLK